MKMKPEIRTHSDLYFNYLEPDPDTIRIEDIAHGLSNTCRFAGQTKFYSVAQHSYLVSCILPPELKLQGLMHDAAEAYIGDVPKPLKNLLPDFMRIERIVEQAIFKKFGLPLELDDAVKWADLVMLSTEKRDLIVTGQEHKWTVDHVAPAEDIQVFPLPPDQAETLFMLRWIELNELR